MSTADERGAGWRERAGLVGAPLGLAASVAGWALWTPLADESLPSDPQLIGAALAGAAAIVLGCLDLGTRMRPGFVQALAALLSVIGGLAALAGVALTIAVIVALAT